MYFKYDVLTIKMLEVIKMLLQTGIRQFSRNCPVYISDAKLRKCEAFEKIERGCAFPKKGKYLHVSDLIFHKF